MWLLSCAQLHICWTTLKCFPPQKVDNKRESITFPFWNYSLVVRGIWKCNCFLQHSQKVLFSRIEAQVASHCLNARRLILDWVYESGISSSLIIRYLSVHRFIRQLFTSIADEWITGTFVESPAQHVPQRRWGDQNKRLTFLPAEKSNRAHVVYSL